MSNILDFPLNAVFNREDFDRAQKNSKKIAMKCVSKANTSEEYALTLAMASGYALRYIQEHRPDVWEVMGQGLQAISHGTGLVVDE